ncbi:Rieske (2Fe-2S) protein [Frankia nepalensis]|uniref:Rieske (2Fe-2S) protein n=1 Tax=Frankia nepalensis TaxID=1836974 RepID=UPI0027DAEAEC|nr:Rieske (2Fe-2S) protein [Frankia nepalensis]
MRTATLSRRATLPLVAVAIGASGYLVAACGSSDDDDTPDSSTAPPAPATSADPGGAGGTGPAEDSLASDSEVPAGGGLVVPDKKVVLTRDDSGTVHAFSAVCTHQGCLVSGVADGTINCACHGSKFNASTGAPVAGPATSPLAPVAVTVQDGGIFLS